MFSVSMFPQNKSSLAWEALWALHLNLVMYEWGMHVFLDTELFKPKYSRKGLSLTCKLTCLLFRELTSEYAMFAFLLFWCIYMKFIK